MSKQLEGLAAADSAPNTRQVFVFGVPIANLSKREALRMLERLITASRGSHAIYIVNAHTLNLACDDGAYHNVLRNAHCVLGDGTGVRWAARARGVRIQANLVGTDLMPALFTSTADRGFRYFLLGADAESIERAANHCRRAYPGWHQAGYHHGYIEPGAVDQVIEEINAAKPHVLLVGMGNPRQERWIHDHVDRLTVPVCVGVGGLFDHWAGNLSRAPQWVRKQGFEWLQLLFQQPHKWRRYLLGNPRFVWRLLRHRGRDLQLAQAPPSSDD